MTFALACLRATRGDCPRCGEEDALLYETDHTDDDTRLCPQCVRRASRLVKRWTVCDNGDGRPAWRNPKTRRNEYLCGPCHVASGDGVVLNKWAPRVSTPLGIQARAECEARNVPGTKDCRGEVKPRKGGHLLCNAHAGKQSSEAPYENRT